MTAQAHPAVLAVHHAAGVVVEHVHHAPSGSFWHRWFDKPDERHFADDVRAFVVTLDYLLDVPPQMLTREDLATVGEETDRVIKKVKAAIEDPNAAGGDVAASLVPAVYIIRARFEELYKRGTSNT